MRKSACWNGCSYTVGEGFPEHQRSTYVYDHLVSKQFSFDSINQAQCGSSNYKIFLKSADAIIGGKYDFVFVQWSALNRLWLYPGPDCHFFLNDEKYPDFRYRDIYIDKVSTKITKNTILLLNHDYQNIFDVVDYCSILEQLANNRTQLIFINGLLPWRDDLVGPMDTADLDRSLSVYTKHILDCDSRDDADIELFVNRLKEKFSQLNLKLWVNVFDSFSNNISDVGPADNKHPGINSNQWMADQISNYLTTNKLI